MNEIQETKRTEALFERVSALIEQARKHVATTVNVTEAYTKYNIGKYIVEDEQKGESRAEYGKQILKDLSIRLTERFGDGWSYPTMKNIRQFYLVYSKRLNGDEPIQKEKAKQCLPISDFANNVDAIAEVSMQLHINSICQTKFCCNKS